VQAHVAADPAFAQALLQEGVEAFLSGDVETGKSILRDYIKATVGFEKLGKETGTQPKSLIRMFGSNGNPQAKNLFGALGYLQKRAGVSLHVTADRQRTKRAIAKGHTPRIKTDSRSGRKIPTTLPRAAALAPRR